MSKSMKTKSELGPCPAADWTKKVDWLQYLTGGEFSSRNKKTCRKMIREWINDTLPTDQCVWRVPGKWGHPGTGRTRSCQQFQRNQKNYAPLQKYETSRSQVNI